MVLGAGRERIEDRIDFGVGALLKARWGEAVQAGDPLVELHYRDATRLPRALALLGHACAISDRPLPEQSLILEVIT